MLNSWVNSRIIHEVIRDNAQQEFKIPKFFMAGVSRQQLNILALASGTADYNIQNSTFTDPVCQILAIPWLA